MSDASNVARSLRERLSDSTEERLGRALSELLDNPILTGAIGRAFDAREKASQAQELAMGALNIPSAADVERLTRRLRSVSLRLEGIEDGVDRLEGALAPAGESRPDLAQRLGAIEQQLARLNDRVDGLAPAKPAKAARRSQTAKAPRAGASAKRQPRASR